MNICEVLERDLRRVTRGQVPPDWRGVSGLETLDRIDDLTRAIRRLDLDSDRVVAALLASGAHDEVATSALVVALLPLVLARCRGRRDCMDEMIGEIALVIVAVREASPIATHRRLASVLVDRAWDRVRRPWRRPSLSLSTGIPELAAVDCGDDPETAAVDRVAVLQIRGMLAAEGNSGRSVVAAWNSVIELSEREHRTRSETDRLKYARHLLRRRLGPELAA